MNTGTGSAPKTSDRINVEDMHTYINNDYDIQDQCPSTPIVQVQIQHFASTYTLYMSVVCESTGNDDE